MIENERCNIMSFDHKITDLKYRINGLVPKNLCQKLIETFEKYSELSGPEQSYKYKDKKIKLDNFNCLNLSRITQRVPKYRKLLISARKVII